ncbi:glycosyl hydrolase family 28-related protein [Nocardioides sp. BP30]|uniref:glycosyl hydrolase family 28-related protein n=1 Tax=Nocardioides sp. BP30 TaxID=3036374 RepID=UPI0024682E34|nr:glycosyl hydrolase family 28-related protein [Nocardioides sp. BP30]WGL50630.1 glycosyl hydrolase family 28-related protein [Nocardioides sp. BP30]
MDITVTSSRPFMTWAATGAGALGDSEVISIEPGVEQTFTLPVTDSSGWLIGGLPVDVTGGKQSHVYNLTLRPWMYGALGVKKYASATITLTGVAVPSGSGTLDLDKAVATAGSQGGTVTIPDLVADLQASVATPAAQAVAARDAAQTYAAQAETISGIATTDDAVSALMDPELGPKTTAGLDARYGRRISVQTFGAKGDYDPIARTGTDDTAAIDAAAAACAPGDTLYFPAGYYKRTTALQVPANVAVAGDGVAGLWGSISSFNSIDVPVVPPYLAGSVIVQCGSGEHGLVMAGAGSTNHVTGLGILFDSPIRFTDTGNGIHAVPPTKDGAYDSGVQGSHWRNVMVFGHDGDHHAYRVINGIYNQMDLCHGYGGGLLYLEGNGTTGAFYGNFLGNQVYGQLFVAGTAHGVHLKAVNGLGMLQFNRLQLSTTHKEDFDQAASSSQHMLFSEWADGTTVNNVSFIAADLETNVGGTMVWPNGTLFVDPASLIDGDFPRFTPTRQGAQAYANSQTIPRSGGWKSLNFSGTEYESNPSCWSSASPAFVNVPVSGMYHIICQASFPGAAGDVYVGYDLGATNSGVQHGHGQGGGTNPSIEHTDIRWLDKGTNVVLNVGADGSGTQTVSEARLTIFRVGI